jgi:hypothetical protein
MREEDVEASRIRAHHPLAADPLSAAGLGTQVADKLAVLLDAVDSLSAVGLGTHVADKLAVHPDAEK